MIIKQRPKYPIYIISKGRWEDNLRLTSKFLDHIRQHYKIVVEPQEYDEYNKVISSRKILTTPFSNLGQGSIPVRNFVWEHSLKNGDERHWILDDNIEYFMRLNRNTKYIVESPIVFKLVEDFVDRYDNVALAGLHYDYFAPASEKLPPYYLNTRVYSCILIKNDIDFRWRGKYNEDTDLSLRVLKAGWCTILFNAFLAGKMPTLTMKGGNTDNVYVDGDKRLKFAESLKEQHPDVVKVVWQYNRWHHEVNYKPFRYNKLIKKPNLNIPDRVNNYGMVVRHVKED